eukprot:scaffold166489_cov33-Tisochrysis_lutea.AAC.3
MELDCGIGMPCHATCRCTRCYICGCNTPFGALDGERLPVDHAEHVLKARQVRYDVGNATWHKKTLASSQSSLPSRQPRPCTMMPTRTRMYLRRRAASGDVRTCTYTRSIWNRPPLGEEGWHRRSSPVIQRRHHGLQYSWEQVWPPRQGASIDVKATPRTARPNEERWPRLPVCT